METKTSLLHQRHALAIHTAPAIVMTRITKTKRATNELVLCYMQGWDLSVDSSSKGTNRQLSFNSLIPLARHLLKLQRWLSQSALSWFLQHSPLVIQAPLIRHSSLSLFPVSGQSLHESCLLVYSF